jgi:hypothetical protein
MTSQSFPRNVPANAEERGPLWVAESAIECIWFKLQKVREGPSSEHERQNAHTISFKLDPEQPGNQVTDFPG